MRLEPVYLVAPLPGPRTMTSRRAFLGMGLAFVGGGVIGSACGYSVGRASATAGGAEDPDELVPSGDPDLDELRRLAVKAPIGDLMAKATQFSTLMSTTYRTDAIAWRGIGRIAAALVDGGGGASRRPLAHWVARVIDQAEVDRRAEYAHWIEPLKAIQ